MGELEMSSVVMLKKTVDVNVEPSRAMRETIAEEVVKACLEIRLRQ